jgi:hypothetical protein
MAALQKEIQGRTVSEAVQEHVVGMRERGLRGSTVARAEFHLRRFFELLRTIDRARFTPVLVTSEPEGYYLARLPKDVEVHHLGHEDSVATRYPVLPLARLVWRLRPDVVLATLRMGFTAGLARTLFPRATRLIVRPEIKSAADLKGKKLGVTRFGTASDFGMRLMVSRLGLNPDTDVAILQIGDNPVWVAALQAKVVDGAIFDPPEYKKAVELDPGYAPGYLNIGALSEIQMEWDGAEKALREAARLNRIEYGPELNAFLKRHPPKE